MVQPLQRVQVCLGAKSLPCQKDGAGNVLGQCRGELASPASPAVCAQPGVHLSTLTGR